MWKVTEHKRSNQQQEIKVAQLVREMAEYSYATYAEQFENHFKERIQEIPRTNNFSADLLYQVTQRNHKSVEVWKMTTQRDFKYKMFTLEFIQ